MKKILSLISIIIIGVYLVDIEVMAAQKTIHGVVVEGYDNQAFQFCEWCSGDGNVANASGIERLHNSYYAAKNADTLDSTIWDIDCTTISECHCKYNCVSYAWYKSDDSNVFNLSNTTGADLGPQLGTFIDQANLDDENIELSNVEKRDIVHYYDATGRFLHAGVILDCSMDNPLDWVVAQKINYECRVTARLYFYPNYENASIAQNSSSRVTSIKIFRPNHTFNTNINMDHSVPNKCTGCENSCKHEHGYQKRVYDDSKHKVECVRCTQFITENHTYVYTPVRPGMIFTYAIPKWKCSGCNYETYVNPLI